MKRRMLGLGLLGLAASGITACGSDGAQKPELGTLSLPLSTQGPSGTTYRLRDAVFEIRNEYYYYGSSGAGGEGSDGITVSSEADPDANAISVSVERGYHYVRLRPGWRLEKVQGNSATDVQATLLTNETVWVYVSPHSTSWVSYQFGLGERSIWFNGDLNIQVEVYEHPSDLYGGGGQGGSPDFPVGGASFGGSP